MPAAIVLVQALPARGTDGDLQEARAAVDRLATASPTDPDMALIEVSSLRLKTLPARAPGGDSNCRDFRDLYRKMANDLGFEGHIGWTEAMP